MDDRLKAALEEGARNGAEEVFAKHEEYMAKLDEEEKRHQQVVWGLGEAYGENETKYNFAQSILSGIINKLDKRE